MVIRIIANAELLTQDAELALAIDRLGEQSALAQELSRAITSTSLFIANAAAQCQQLYVAIEESQPVGFLKIGVKHLFYVNRKGEYTEMDALCVLDFYVEEHVQRLGLGLKLFQSLLEAEQKSARLLAYDRPSSKLLAFLRKHAQLTEFFPQPNNFVIFDDYFQPALESPNKN